MKKSTIHAALVALMMASCTDDPTIDTYNGNAIGFSSFSVKPTRAAEKTAFAVGDAFGVYAYHDTIATPYSTAGLDTLKPSFMYNQEVTYDGTKWNYSPLQFWPATGYIHFFAYTPYDASPIFTPTASASGAPQMSFTVPTSVDDQVDFMVAKAVNQARPATPAAVNMPFKHTLAQVRFIARSGREGVIFNIEQLELHGIKSTGKIKLNEDSVWTNLDMDARYVAILNDNKANVHFEDGGEADYVSLTDPGSCMMLIPQQLTGGTLVNNGIAPPSSGAYIYIKFGAKYTSGATAISGETGRYFPVTFKLQPGKRHNIKITLNCDDLLFPIQFEAAVDSNWEDV